MRTAGIPVFFTLGNNDSYSGDYVSDPNGKFYQDMGRFGLPLFQGLMNYLDKADSSFVAAYRKHDDQGFHIEQSYVTAPNLNGRPLIIADPMLATGASFIKAIPSLLSNGLPSEIHIVCVIASQEGINYVKQALPEAHIWVGAIDPRLNDKSYILPGLGDAGDLCFGEKLQN